MKLSRTRHRRNDAGFTLVEAVLATALMAMILAAIATVTAQWLPNWNRGFASVQRNELFTLGFERLVADLAAAEFIPKSRQSVEPLFEGTETSVVFVRSALGPNTRAGLQIIRVAEMPDGRVPALVRTQGPFVPMDTAVVANFGNPVVLARAPYRITFSYAGSDRVWLSTWTGASLLPRAIRVQVRDAATDRVLAVSTATVVHSEVPSDCVMAEVMTDCLNSKKQRATSLTGTLFARADHSELSQRAP
jgi:general secretion pathway protein J